MKQKERSNLQMIIWLLISFGILTAILIGIAVYAFFV